MSPELYHRLTGLLAQEPRPTAAELHRILTSEGHQIQSPTTPYRWLRNGIPARCRPADIEATRAVIRARAAELGLLESDGLTPRHGALVAISRKAEKEGRGLTRARVSQAWRDGVVNLAEWPLFAPFAVNPGDGGESEKKDAVSPCAA